MESRHTTIQEKELTLPQFIFKPKEKNLRTECQRKTFKRFLFVKDERDIALIQQGCGCREKHKI